MKTSEPTKSLKCIHEGCKKSLVVREDEKAEYLCPEHAIKDSHKWRREGGHVIGGLYVRSLIPTSMLKGGYANWNYTDR